MKVGSWGSSGISVSKAWALAPLFWLAMGCQVKNTTVTTTGGSIPTYSAPQSNYCGQTTVGAGSTISGKAYYQRREVVVGVGLGGAGAARPIRYAEVWVTNAAGARVACTETDGAGNYSFNLAPSAQDFTVSVNSRANPTVGSLVNTVASPKYAAYVYDDPRYNNFYSLSQTFTDSLTTKALPDMTADVNAPEVLGGAFSILDQILEANDYLRAQVGNCSAALAGCLNFTVAPLVTVYWKIGFNPGSYYNTGGLSFYLPSYRRLFILGGIDDEFNHSDTDHFDNSVVLHEYGHFLEDVFFSSDSPGGNHTGNGLIDPRLAWSEGWGNFFQAAVRASADYIDTVGNTSDSTSFAFNVDLENQVIDVPVNVGEGNFREFSVTRLLWDTVDAAADALHGGTDNINSAFNQLWHSLSSTSGWKYDKQAFRQAGTMQLFQQTLGQASWGDLRLIERQDGDMSEYGQYVSTLAGPCANYSMTTSSSATYSLLRNNDYYHLYLTAAQTVTIVLDYVQVAPAVDLDLLIYNESAVINDSSDIVGKSQATPAGGAGTALSETVTKYLPAGHYLINVQAWQPPNNQVVSYTLKKGVTALCPDILP
jgi:hypothetical protein